MKSIVLLLLIFSWNTYSFAQVEKSESPIIFICDASGSMWGQVQGEIKMKIASDVLSDAVNNLPESQKIGLVAYGHRKKGDCKDVEFLVDFNNESKTQIISALQSIEPLGRTPLAYSAEQLIDQLRSTNTKATIILVTDGIESCDGDLCEVVKVAKKEGIEFRLHIIGFGLAEGETDQLKCAAIAGDGNYYDAANAGGLKEVLNEATSKTVDKPQENVSVFAVKNGASIDAWVKAVEVSGKGDPVSVRTYGDTGYFHLPAGIYNFEVKPLGGSDVNSVVVSDVQSFDDKMVHQDISFDGGKVEITTTNNGSNWDCLVKLLDPDGKVAAAVRTYQSPKEVEVNPGTYKITIQALAIEGLHTYTEIDNIDIKSAGMVPIVHDFKTGTAFIDAKVDGKSIDSIVTISEANSREKVAGGRTYNRGKEFLLNPGIYSVKVVPLGEYKDRNAQNFTMEVKKGEATSKTINL